MQNTEFSYLNTFLRIDVLRQILSEIVQETKIKFQISIDELGLMTSPTVNMFKRVN